MKTIAKYVCLFLALMVPAIAFGLEPNEEMVGWNDAGFTFCGIDMGDRNLTQDQILMAIATKSGMEPFAHSDMEYVISNDVSHPECLSGYAGMISVVFEEINEKLFFAADMLLLPKEKAALEDSCDYQTAKNLFNDSRKLLRKAYGDPDDVSVSYWDAAKQERTSFRLVNDAFLFSAWSLVEQSEYGCLSARYGNAEVRLQREQRGDKVIHTCWLKLAAYEK